MAQRRTTSLIIRLTPGGTPDAPRMAAGANHPGRAGPACPDDPPPKSVHTRFIHSMSRTHDITRLCVLPVYQCCVA
jgi:hypothetical protein